MSVVITCNLSDGVLIGTDSAITIQGRVPSPVGVQTGILKIYNNTEKLFQLEELPVAVATCGIGMLGERSIGSYVKEFEFTIKEGKDNELETKSVKQIAEALRKFFLKKYKEVLASALEKELNIKYSEIPDEKKPLLELIVAGFSPKEYLSEVWHIRIPLKDDKFGLICVREKGQFGTNWFGITEPIFRLIKGYGRNVPNLLIDYLVKTYKIGFEDKDKIAIEGILKGFEYQIPYAAMPIQEGADHVNFLLDLVINQTKYVIGAEVCGGPVKIGVVQRGEKEFRIITDNKISISNQSKI